MHNENLRVTEGLREAIKAERDGYSFYLMAAGSTADPKGKNIFETLASEELDHMNFLHRQHESILQTGKPNPQIKFGSRLELSGMSPIFSSQLKERIKDAHIEMSALSIGIQLELEAIKFYRAQSDAAIDPDIKKFFAELAEWETGHYQALAVQQNELKEDYWSSGGFAPF